jgi:hypothetical protein
MRFLPERSIGAFSFGEILCGECLGNDVGCSAATGAGVRACAVSPQVAVVTMAAIATLTRLPQRVLTDIEFSLYY